MQECALLCALSSGLLLLGLVPQDASSEYRAELHCERERLPVDASSQRLLRCDETTYSSRARSRHAQAHYEHVRSVQRGPNDTPVLVMDGVDSAELVVWAGRYRELIGALAAGGQAHLEQSATTRTTDPVLPWWPGALLLGLVGAWSVWVCGRRAELAVKDGWLTVRTRLFFVPLRSATVPVADVRWVVTSADGLRFDVANAAPVVVPVGSATAARRRAVAEQRARDLADAYRTYVARATREGGEVEDRAAFLLGGAPSRLG